MKLYWLSFWVALFCVGVVLGEEKPGSYQKNVLMDLCQFIGVSYVRNPENPECGYIACWDRHPYYMPCAPGMKVHPLFFWGDSYPCTEKDGKDSCNYIKQYYNGKAPQAGTRVRTPGYSSEPSGVSSGPTKPVTSSSSSTKLPTTTSNKDQHSCIQLWKGRFIVTLLVITMMLSIGSALDLKFWRSFLRRKPNYISISKRVSDYV